MRLKRMIAIVFVISWMGLIFYFSNQPGNTSSGTSNKVAEIMVNILDIKNEKTQEEKQLIISKWDPYLRKLAHYTIFALGGLLICHMFYQFQVIHKTKWSILIGCLYACSDEFHQLFIIGRSGRIVDIWIDTLGIATGVFVFLFLKESLKKIKNRGGNHGTKYVK